jgi:hypothetical protein
MKKTQPALQQKPRRLTLNRETIRFLDDPALLGLARGGRTDDTTLSMTVTTQESTSGPPTAC